MSERWWGDPDREISAGQLAHLMSRSGDVWVELLPYQHPVKVTLGSFRRFLQDLDPDVRFGLAEKMPRGELPSRTVVYLRTGPAGAS